MRDGKPLLKDDGTSFNHIKETNNSQHGIKKIIDKLKPQLKKDPPLSPAEKKQVQKEISICSLILEYSERFHPSKPKKQVLEEAAKETAENTRPKKTQKKSLKGTSKKSSQK